MATLINTVTRFFKKNRQNGSGWADHKEYIQFQRQLDEYRTELLAKYHA